MNLPSGIPQIVIGLWMRAVRTQLRAQRGEVKWSKAAHNWRALSDASHGYPHDQLVYNKLAEEAEKRAWARNMKPTIKVQR